MAFELVSLLAYVVQHGPEIVDPLFEQGSARVCLHENPAVQGIVGVSDAAQIERIKKEAAGVPTQE